jgi:thiamine pyrophosphokinase
MSSIVIFAGGEHPAPGVAGELPTADLWVAADGGYEIASRMGIVIDVVVGDLDSVGPLPRHVTVERHPADKDATDLELALDRALRSKPDRVVVVGGAGGRQDHELATAILLCSDRYAEIDELDWISHRARAHVVRGRRQIHGDVGDTVSLLALNGDASGVTTTGLQWALTDENLPAGSTRGVSNRFVSPVASIEVRRGVVLAVCPTGAS